MPSFLSMIGAELLKARRKKRFVGLLMVLAVLVPLMQLLSAYFAASRLGGTFVDQGDIVRQAADQIASPFNLSRNYLGAVLPVLHFVIAAVAAAFLVGEERGYRMWKVILTVAPDRRRVLAAKFMAGMVILGAITLAGLAGGLVFGTIGVVLGLASGFGGDWGTLVPLYLLQWLALGAPLALGFLLALVVASPAIVVIGVVVLPGIIENLVRAGILAQAQRLSLLNAPFQAFRVQDALASAERYFLTPNLNLGTRYLGEAVGQAFDSQGGFRLPLGTFDWPGISWSLAVCAAYAALFLGLGLWSFLRRDIHE